MEASKSMRRKAVLASVIGSTLEWYDFLVYGTLAGLVLNKHFFPASDPFVSNLLAWGSAGLAFVSRPLGGLLFGHFGDRIGRKAMLTLTLLIMGGATVLLGCLPTYEQVGILAPIGVIVLRLIQGIGLGGEWGGAVLMTYEYATPTTRCFYASLTQLGLSIGLFTASGVVGLLTFFMSTENFNAWGWRLPFLVSILMLVVGWYIRVSVMETPDFQKAMTKKKDAQTHKVPLVELFGNHKKRIVAGVLARAIGAVSFNVLGNFMVAYLSQYIKVPRQEALLAVNVGTIFMVLMVPFAGWLGDRYGRMRMYRLGCLLEGLCAFPIFYLVNHASGNFLVACSGLALYLGCVHGIVAGLNPSMCSSLFPVQVRYSGTAFTFETANLCFAAFTPMLAVYLLHVNDNKPWLLCTYMVCISLLSVVASTWIKKDQEREERAAAAREERAAGNETRIAGNEGRVAVGN